MTSNDGCRAADNAARPTIATRRTAHSDYFFLVALLAWVVRKLRDAR